MINRFFDSKRRHSRQQLVLKVEFDDPEGFRSNFLSDLSEGGLRLHTELHVGQRFTLNISFLGFVEPIQIEAEVQWSLPEEHPEGPASGLAFVNPTPEARAWLFEILDHSTQVFINPAGAATRIALLEKQPFLREIYGQEVRNWADLNDISDELEFTALDNSSAWLDEVTRAASTLGIVDVDDLAADVLSLYRTVRHNTVSSSLPLIMIGTPENIAQFDGLNDDLLMCLRKPLKFGLLMNTVRMLARVD